MKLHPSITAAIIGIFGGLIITLTQIYLSSTEKKDNNISKQEICKQMNSGISVSGGTVHGNISSHTGDNIYGTSVKTNFEKKEKKCN